MEAERLLGRRRRRTTQKNRLPVMLAHEIVESLG
jgi:hypothetical protein